MKIYDKESFEALLKQKFPNNDITVLSFSGTYKSISYRCNSCGRIYNKTRANHLYENKTLCQKCYSARDSVMRDWILDFLKNSTQFSLVEPWYGMTSVSLQLYCNNCHRQFAKKPSNLYQRQESTICPYCGDNGAPVLWEDFYQRLSSQEQEEYTFSNYHGIDQKMKIQHKCGFVFYQKPINFLKSRGCPHCYGNRSVGEKKIEEFLIINHFEYESQKRFPELGRLSYDFYIPELRLLIEYQGEQHYKPVDIFGGEEHFLFQQKSDQSKREYAKSNGYILLEIPYYDLKKINTYLVPLLAQRLSSNGVENKLEMKNLDDIV